MARSAAATAAARASERGSERSSDAPLANYNAKRDFKLTSEPAGRRAPRVRKANLSFVVQKHWASHLHYDFRLELDGVMVSWAVPKGPTFDPAIKQLAIHVEDHPLSYNTFEGTIPKGQYGAGTVIVWDQGTWVPVGDPREGLEKGKLIFKLHGQKLAGLWELVRISKPGEKKQDQWLLLKKRGDAWAQPTSEYDVISALPDSVIEQPLGLIEERAPRLEAPAAPRKIADGEPDLSQAVLSPLPAKLSPQLATLVNSPPTVGDWIVENKFDGYRLLARIAKGKVRLLTRNGNDWTDKLERLATEVESLGLESGWLDGEIVVLNEGGVPDFNRLQNAIDNSRSGDIVYFLFDVPFLGDRDLRRVPLASRRAVLKALMNGRTSDRVKFSEAFDAPPAELLEAACRIGLEGVMIKRADAPYASERSETWLKLKCQRRQEFVVIGFTDRAGASGEAGSLLLGYYDGGELRYAGAVGTGWNNATGKELHKIFSSIEIEKPAVDPKLLKPGRWSKRAPGTERWVKPERVVEVAFGEWTPDGHVRHPSFKGLRTDKPSRSITREMSAAAPTRVPAKAADSPRAQKPSPPVTSATTSVKVTNPDRVIDPSTGLQKVDLVRYYESIGSWMLPHLKKRPVSLVRAPQGISGQLFFQKHPETKVAGVTELDPALWPGHASLMSVDSATALVSAAQMNTVEFHTWNSTIRSIDRPDRMVFDLDPGEGVTWLHVQEAATLTRVLLQELGLESWLKTSGGKGLHVVVPLAPKIQYEIVKAFSQAIVQHIAKTIPQRFVAKSGGSNRVGKIFIDYLRNGHGQTTAAAFSARARPGLGVSMPISWEQLVEVKSGARWTIVTAREYLSFQKSDPWSEYWASKQTLPKAMKALGFTANDVEPRRS